MKNLIVLCFVLCACAKNNSASISQGKAVTVNPGGVAISDVMGSYTLEELDCYSTDMKSILQSTTFVGQNGPYTESMTIDNGGNLSDTLSDSVSQGTYTGTISIDQSGITLSTFFVTAATNNACTIWRADFAQNLPNFTALMSFNVGQIFSQTDTADYIWDSKTGRLSIKTLGAQAYGNNCYFAYLKQ